MIRQQPQGVNPKWELTIASAAVNYTSINGMHIFLSENKHDMLTFDMAGLPARALTDYIGKVVLLKINTGPNYTYTFVGRVERVLPKATTHRGTVNNSGFQESQVMCLGRSYDMRGKKNASWSGQTLPQIATTIARRYDLSLDVPATPLLYNTSVQASESDWQFLVRMCEQHGYSITCHGTHLHIFDPYEALGRQASMHKLATQRILKGYAKATPGAIIEFTPTFQDRHPDGEYMDTVVTVLTEDGETFDVSTREVKGVTTPARFTNRIPEEVDNYEEAVRKVTEHDKHEYDYTADVQAVGMLGVVPGGVVNLAEYGGDFDGYWYVQEVEHHLTSEMFTTELKIARNKNSELVARNVQRFQTPPPPKQGASGTLVTSRRAYNVY